LWRKDISRGRPVLYAVLAWMPPGGETPWRVRRAFVGSVAKYCAAHACCPVLVVPPSPLPRRIGRIPERTLHVET
jgi:hypothetical protein